MRFLFAVAALCIATSVCEAGMPSLLPTGLTAEAEAKESTSQNPSVLPRVQALSFFVVVFLSCAWAFQKLWNSVRGDWPAMPQLGYWRSVGLVVLWSLLFSVVLTMVSGARELMTPGAWKKQGWTYTLNSPPTSETTDQRNRSLEHLKVALWQYARDHDGRFPAQADDVVDPSLWEFAGWKGLKLHYVPGLKPETAGRILVYEPEIDGERMALLTNGAIARMPSRELEQLLASPGGAP